MKRKQTDRQGNDMPFPQTADDLDYRLLFNLIAENTSEETVLLDLDGRFLFINAATAKYLNRKPETLLGRHFSEFIREEDASSIEQLLKRIASSKTIIRRSFSATIQGERRYFNVNGEPVQNADGRVIAIMVIAEDVTQATYTQQDLARAQAFQHALIGNLQEAIVIFDDYGNPLDVNPAIIEMVGFSREEIIGNKDTPHVIFPNDLTRFQFVDLIKNQGFAQGELEMTRKGGEKFIFSFYGVGNVSPGQHIVVGRDITGQKKIEQDLIESEERYRTLFETAQEAILIFNNDLKCVEVNPYLLNMSGYNREEFLQLSVNDLFPDLDISELDEAIRSTDTLNIHQGEYQLTRRDGKIMDIEYSLIRNYLPGLHLLLMHDITERKNSGEALRESEARYSSLVNLSPSAISIVQENKYVYANPAAAMILGYDNPNDVIGMPVENSISTHFQQLIKERIIRSLAGEKNEFTLLEIQQPDGNTRQIESFSVPYKYNDKPATLVMSIDVTDRLAQENLLSTFYKAAPLGVGIVVGRQIIQANEMFCQMTGYELRELLNQDARMLYFNDEDYQMVGIQKDEQMNEIGVATTETRFRRKDGSSLDVLISSVPFDKNDWSKGINTVVLDISERKQAERILQNLNLELEERVHTRTQQLEKKTVELESFAYSVSHDLRAPLRAINGLSQILLDDYAMQWQNDPKGLLNNIIAASEKMGQQIDGLLLLSRMGQKHLSVAPTDIGQLAAEVYQDLAEQVPDREITFDHRETPPVYADPQLVEIALTNLIANAIKFTRLCEHARIEFGITDQDGKTVYYLKDNGIGFDQKYASKLFAPFQRLVTEETFEGTGIGLTIVKRIVERHNGDIWVESKRGEGTIFFFTLNLPPDQDTEENSAV